MCPCKSTETARNEGEEEGEGDREREWKAHNEARAEQYYAMANIFRIHETYYIFIMCIDAFYRICGATSISPCDVCACDCSFYVCVVRWVMKCVRRYSFNYVLSLEFSAVFSFSLSLSAPSAGAPSTWEHERCYQPLRIASHIRTLHTYVQSNVIFDGWMRNGMRAQFMLVLHTRVLGHNSVYFQIIDVDFS